jgi:hypothetical protein
MALNIGLYVSQSERNAGEVNSVKAYVTKGETSYYFPTAVSVVPHANHPQ